MKNLQLTGSPRYQCAPWYHPPYKCGGRGRLRRQPDKFQFVGLLWETGKYIILYLISHILYLIPLLPAAFELTIKIS